LLLRMCENRTSSPAESSVYQTLTPAAILLPHMP